MAFMIPQALEMTESEAREWVEEPARAEGGDPDPAAAGWYGRLSAPGYMDCTDWVGPFPRAWMALRAVCSTFDVDLSGEDRTDG